MREESARLKQWGNCPACGHHNGEWETRCEKCGRRLSTLRAMQQAAAAAPRQASPLATSQQNPAGGQAANRSTPKIVPRPPAFPEHLRQHLQARVQRFRSRKEDHTLALPFEPEPEPPAKIITFPAAVNIVTEQEEPVPRSRAPRESRSSEAPAAPPPQPALDFQPGVPEEQVWRLRPVAPVRLRLSAHWTDVRVVGGATALFLLGLPLIHLLGGDVVPKLILLGGLVCGSLLLALLYGLLFLWGAGATPGMKAARLRLVNFDGMPATRQQRLLRLFGAVVSAGSFLIGFLWAAVDEEKLYWHDHISKTYLTMADS
jgi:RDD family protein